MIANIVISNLNIFMWVVAVTITILLIVMIKQIIRPKSICTNCNKKKSCMIRKQTHPNIKSVDIKECDHFLFKY